MLNNYTMEFKNIGPYNRGKFDQPIKAKQLFITIKSKQQLQRQDKREEKYFKQYFMYYFLNYITLESVMYSHTRLMLKTM